MQNQPNPWKTIYEKQKSGEFQAWTPSRDKAIELRKHHPEMTLQEIGTELGISRERVRQILASEKLPTHAIGRPTVPMPNCAYCGTSLPNRRRKFCGPECQYPNGTSKIPCHFCGKEIILMTSQYKVRTSNANHMHCSRICRDNSRRGKSIVRYNT